MSEKPTFGTFGRYTELPIDQMPAEHKEAYDLMIRARGEVPDQYKIWLQNPHLTKAMVSVGKYFQRSHSSLSDAQREIVVNLINAKWLTAYSNHEHEKIGENAGLRTLKPATIRLSPPAVEILARHETTGGWPGCRRVQVNSSGNTYPIASTLHGAAVIGSLWWICTFNGPSLIAARSGSPAPRACTNAQGSRS